jgi:hypothetical protein
MGENRASIDRIGGLQCVEIDDAIGEFCSTRSGADNVRVWIRHTGIVQQDARAVKIWSHEHPTSVRQDRTIRGYNLLPILEDSPCA